MEQTRASSPQFSKSFISRTSPPSGDMRKGRRTNFAWSSSSSPPHQQMSSMTLADLASSPHFGAGSGQRVGGAGRPRGSPPAQEGDGRRFSPSPPQGGRWDDGVNYASDLLDPGSMHQRNLDLGVHGGIEHGASNGGGEGGAAAINGFLDDGATATFTPPSRASDRSKRISALKENLLARSQESQKHRGISERENQLDLGDPAAHPDFARSLPPSFTSPKPNVPLSLSSPPKKRPVVKNPAKLFEHARELQKALGQLRCKFYVQNLYFNVSSSLRMKVGRAFGKWFRNVLHLREAELQQDYLSSSRNFRSNLGRVKDFYEEKIRKVKEEAGERERADSVRNFRANARLDSAALPPDEEDGVREHRANARLSSAAPTPNVEDGGEKEEDGVEEDKDEGLNGSEVAAAPVLAPSQNRSASSTKPALKVTLRKMSKLGSPEPLPGMKEEVNSSSLSPAPAPAPAPVAAPPPPTLDVPPSSVAPAPAPNTPALSTSSSTSASSKGSKRRQSSFRPPPEKLTPSEIMDRRKRERNETSAQMSRSFGSSLRGDGVRRVATKQAGKEGRRGKAEEVEKDDDLFERLNAKVEKLTMEDFLGEEQKVVVEEKEVEEEVGGGEEEEEEEDEQEKQEQEQDGSVREEGGGVKREVGKEVESVKSDASKSQNVWVESELPLNDLVKDPPNCTAKHDPASVSTAVSPAVSTGMSTINTTNIAGGPPALAQPDPAAFVNITPTTTTTTTTPAPASPQPSPSALALATSAHYSTDFAGRRESKKAGRTVMKVEDFLKGAGNEGIIKEM